MILKSWFHIWPQIGSFSAHILQNIDFNQAENLLRANQNLNGSSDAMVTPEIDENVKDDIIFHAKFLLEVTQFLLAYIIVLFDWEPPKPCVSGAPEPGVLGVL